MKTFQVNEEFTVCQTEIKHFDGIVELCKKVYPFDEPWAKDQLASHLEHFPEGQVIILDNATEQVVGMSACLIVNWHDYEMDDKWIDMTDNGYFTNHDSSGLTLYGAEMIVHPAYRGKGLGKMLYARRREICTEHNLLRMRAGARLRGYSKCSEEMEAHQYLYKVLTGEIYDPTISFQVKEQFHIVGLIGSYLPDDPETLGWAVVIEWLNPDCANHEDYLNCIGRYQRIFRLDESDLREFYRKLCIWSGHELSLINDYYHDYR